MCVCVWAAVRVCVGDRVFFCVIFCWCLLLIVTLLVFICVAFLFVLCVSLCVRVLLFGCNCVCETSFVCVGAFLVCLFVSTCCVFVCACGCERERVRACV